MPWIRKVNAGRGFYKRTALAYSDDAQWIEADIPARTLLASQLGPNAHTQDGRYIETDITPYAIGEEWDKLKPGEQSSKYFNLVKPEIDTPVPTITATGAVLSAASIVHPTERRKFTIDELKLISSFPADFQLTGTFAQQWERIGRAVPPLMARAVAEVIRDEVLAKCAV